MQSVYLQRIMKKNAYKGYEKTKPKQTQFPKVPKITQTLFHKRIMKMNHLQAPKKQSQNKPCPERSPEYVEGRSRMGQFSPQILKKFQFSILLSCIKY